MEPKTPNFCPGCGTESGWAAHEREVEIDNLPFRWTCPSCGYQFRIAVIGHDPTAIKH